MWWVRHLHTLVCAPVLLRKEVKELPPQLRCIGAEQEVPVACIRRLASAQASPWRLDYKAGLAALPVVGRKYQGSLRRRGSLMPSTLSSSGGITPNRYAPAGTSSET